MKPTTIIQISLALLLQIGSALAADPLDQWHIRNPAVPSGNYQGIAFGNGIFVVVGQIILGSPDGVHWTPRYSGTGLDFETVAFLSGTFITIGASGAMMVSPDGIRWFARSSGTSATLYGIA